MATTAQMRDLGLWLDHYSGRVAELDRRNVAAVAAAYAGINDWTDPGQTVPAALAATSSAQAARQMQAGFATEFLRFATGLLINLRRLNLPRNVGIEYPRPVAPFDVYSRPVFEARRTLELAGDEDAAAKVAMARLEDIVLTDAALVRREASQQFFTAVPQITGYRRVIRPELSETGTCAICIAAALQRYKTGYLLPIHTRCKCTVLPILDGDDPAVVFNQEDLEAAYATAPGTVREDLVKTRFTVVNTELGPTLTPHQPEAAKQRKDGSRPKRPKTEAGGGSDQPPRGPKAPPAVPEPEPDDPESPEGRAYWARRRDALGLDFGRDADQVRPPEIKTIERLQALGGTLVSIPRDNETWTSTSDFDWTPDGSDETHRIEIKSLQDTTNLHKATFPMRIKKSVGRSMAHGDAHRKRKFIVDAGDRLVLADVRRALRSYNRDNPDHQVDAIWLMSAGSIERIVLE